ncbi:MAG: hypothetical protein R3F62_01900 [Planctomycetota bacterium]
MRWSWTAGLVGALLLGGCCPTVRPYDDPAWERAVDAAQALVEARGGYDVEVERSDDAFVATWRQELPPLAGVFLALVLVEPCDRWVRLELERDEAGFELAARVVYLDFVLFVIPTFGTEDEAEERLIERFDQELARPPAAPPAPR